MWDKGGRCVGLTLPTSCAAGSLSLLDPQGLSRAVMGLLYLSYVAMWRHSIHSLYSQQMYTNSVLEGFVGGV